MIVAWEEWDLLCKKTVTMCVDYICVCNHEQRDLRHKYVEYF